MLQRIIVRSAVAVFLTTNLVMAAPEDYKNHIPHNIDGMELMDWGLLDDQLVVYYGESIGRATLRVFPAPEADPRGAQSEDPETSGATPAAQRAMLDLLSENLTLGTNALGDGYTTNPVLFTQKRHAAQKRPARLKPIARCRAYCPAQFPAQAK